MWVPSQTRLKRPRWTRPARVFQQAVRLCSQRSTVFPHTNTFCGEFRAPFSLNICFLKWFCYPDRSHQGRTFASPPCCDLFLERFGALDCYKLPCGMWKSAIWSWAPTIKYLIMLAQRVKRSSSGQFTRSEIFLMSKLVYADVTIIKVHQILALNPKFLAKYESLQLLCQLRSRLNVTLHIENWSELTFLSLQIKLEWTVEFRWFNKSGN